MPDPENTLKYWDKTLGLSGPVIKVWKIALDKQQFIVIKMAVLVLIGFSVCV